MNKIYPLNVNNDLMLGDAVLGEWCGCLGDHSLLLCFFCVERLCVWVKENVTLEQ